MIRSVVGAAVLLAVTAAVPLHAQDELASPALRIEWPAFKKLYDARDVLVVDVRDRASFDAGHIPGAISVPLNDVERRADELKKSGKPIVVYCA
jgi:rhodanese-related sulfurtransferase